VNDLQMFLEGSGMERRPVTLFATSKVSIVTRFRGASTVVDGQILVDADGQMATQVDVDGLRYQFQRSPVIWSLLYG